MNNRNTGSSVSILLAIAVLLLAWGNVYLIYENNKIENRVLTVQTSLPVRNLQTKTLPQKTVATQSGKCGLIVASPAADSVAHFPLTISGIVDNSKRQSLGCSWQMFEGQAGVAQLFYNYNNEGWKALGVGSPVKVSDWTATTTPFSFVLNFKNDGIGLPNGTPMKIVFTEENASGMPPVDSFELPVIFQ